MRHRNYAAVVALIAALATAACASSGFRTEEPESDRSSRERQPATVRVQNDSQWALRVFVISGGDRRQIGSMHSLDTAVFQIPSSVLSRGGGIRLAADPTGPRFVYLSEQVLVNPGDLVEWNIQNNPSHTSISVSGD